MAPAKYLLQTHCRTHFDHVIAKNCYSMQRGHSELATSAKRLGEHAGFMLGIYQQVQAVAHEEILSSLKQAPPTSQVGRMTKWIPHLQSSICQSAFGIEEAVGQEAYELTEYWQDTAGCCRCSSVD